MRFFKRHNGSLKQFNRWSPFAFSLCYESCTNIVNSLPSEYIGREVFKILKRSEILPENVVMNPDFYQCEIFFTDSEPVGIMSLFFKEKPYQLEYVSPMVVRKPTEPFRDSNFIICDTWLPLYKNRETWRNFGMQFYLLALNLKKRQLMDILSWLQVKTAEKYKLMYADLVQVAKILFGDDESRWFLKP